MRRIFACGAVAFILCFFCACSLIKLDGTVKLLVESPQGKPIDEIYVYAEQSPDGSDIFPGPLLGVTPETYGTQDLTFLKYGFTADGAQRRKTEDTVPYGIVSIEITREDVEQNRTISVQVPSVPFSEE